MADWAVGKKRIRPQPSTAEHRVAGGGLRTRARQARDAAASTTPPRKWRWRDGEAKEATTREAAEGTGADAAEHRTSPPSLTWRFLSARAGGRASTGQPNRDMAR